MADATLQTAAELALKLDLGSSTHSYVDAFDKQSAHCLDGRITHPSKYAVAFGGFADIWEGFMGTRKVAIKTIRPFSSSGKRYGDNKLLRRVRREYLAWTSVSHPNVLECLGFSYDFSREPHVLPSLISPWMSNGTVFPYIETFPDTDRLALLLGVAQGLSYLHERQITHGNLRAGNILISDSGVPCLSDFGLSRTMQVEEMTTTSELAGSLRWMSPELLVDHIVANSTTDVWAYGMTILEILSGHHPYYEFKKDATVLDKLKDGQIPSRPQDLRVSSILIDRVWTVCQQCWILQPRQRPPIHQVIAKLSGTGRRPPPEPEVPRNELGGLPRSAETVDKPLKQQLSFKWAYHVDNPARSPTRVEIDSDIDSPKGSPLGQKGSPLGQKGSPLGQKHGVFSPNVSPKGNREAQVYSEHPNTLRVPAKEGGGDHSPKRNSTALAIGDTPVRSDSSDGLKSFKVSLDDPAWRVLPAALKKYRINTDDWQNYAMFIHYGTTASSVFMLKHIRDIQSPIAVAQQKQTARQITMATETGIISTGRVDRKVVGKDVALPKDLSYGVAIYPYMANQEDEFDVVMSDSFIILQRAKGWYLVQRDATGSGIIESDASTQGWIPTGCLLEINLPVASAVAAATDWARSAADGPILPLNVISTSFPGIALVDFERAGEEQLALKKGDALRAFKRYNHWSYVVKEDGGARGWVPSWYIGKVGAVIPLTPDAAFGPNGSTQVSAMQDSDLPPSFVATSLDGSG